MLCCRSAIPSSGLGRFAVLRWPVSSTKIRGASLTGIYSDAAPYVIAQVIAVSAFLATHEQWQSMAVHLSASQTVGRIFALSRNRFVGSYRFFNETKRSKFEPYADLTCSSSSLIASSTALTYALGS